MTGGAPPHSSEPVSRREILAWCLYDFANSSFSVIVTTVVFSRYFQQFVVVGDAQFGSLLWGIAISVSMLLVGFASPPLGAMADLSASKKRGVVVFTAVCVAATAALWFVKPGDVALAMILFIVANIGFAGSFSFYNGFLPEITTEENVGRVSGMGFAWGYVGGLACLAVCLPLLLKPWAPETLGSVRASFLVTAAFFAVFTVPIVLWLKERAVPQDRVAFWPLTRAAFGRLSETLRHVREYEDLFKYLIAFLIYNDAIETVIFFSPVFASAVLGFSDAEVLYLFAAVQATAFLGAWALAGLTDRIGAARMVVLTLLVWCGLVGWAYFITTKPLFWVMALLAGLVLGPCQAASRSLMSLFVPRGRSAEFFGFFSISGKFSAILGPLVFGWATWAFGSHRAGLLSTLFFFVAGLLLLLTVNVDRGKRAAGET
ncbi:MAG: MFS transporter [Acidobacteria bacterium]|nr:MFS transporter [Acidobacteriota bacterium]